MKPMSNSIRCFVASAFDHVDVDAIYDKAIGPVLRILECSPQRVDRVVHNDDIDKKILALIESCNFCIADLTYARPSVYYEAGYAFGIGRPVIYIARSDHFRDTHGDVVGNLRVHFDLQMKNIIPWKEPNAAFIKRLKSQVSLVIKPIQKLMAHAAEERACQERFSSNSENVKQYQLIEATRDVLRRKRFKEFAEANIPNARSYLHMTRVHRSTLQIVQAFAVPTLTRKRLSDLRMLSFMGREDGRTTAPAVELYLLFACLAGIRSSTLAGAFPHFAPVACRSGHGVSAVKVRAPLTDDNIAVLDAPRSREEYIDRCEQLLADLHID
jgi:nucleoside 2-deoxyribosyltransferase